MNDKKIFLVERELHSIKKVYAKILKEVEITSEEIEHLKTVLEIEIADIQWYYKEHCKICENLLKKLEGLK